MENRVSIRQWPGGAALWIPKDRTKPVRLIVSGETDRLVTRNWAARFAVAMRKAIRELEAV